MTVCIAAACGNGDTIVTATDGQLSTIDAYGDIVPGKMLWHGPWQFMYAGLPEHFAMIEEEVGYIVLDNAEAFSRRNVQETVRRAYRRVSSRFASFDSLGPFDMTMEDLKREGVDFFGETFHTDLLRQIQSKGSAFNEQIIVTGWGHSPHSAMIYSISPVGDSLHDAAGFTTIGSGANMALNTLLWLEQARHRTLADTIFNVACAKFSAERAGGVGKMTTMYVSQKGEKADEQRGKSLQEREVDALRDLWEKHLKPRIPSEAFEAIGQIAARVNDGKVSMRDAINTFKAKLDKLEDLPE